MTLDLFIQLPKRLRSNRNLCTSVMKKDPLNYYMHIACSTWSHKWFIRVLKLASNTNEAWVNLKEKFYASEPPRKIKRIVYWIILRDGKQSNWEQLIHERKNYLPVEEMSIHQQRYCLSNLTKKDANRFMRRIPKCVYTQDICNHIVQNVNALYFEYCPKVFRTKTLEQWYIKNNPNCWLEEKVKLPQTIENIKLWVETHKHDREAPYYLSTIVFDDEIKIKIIAESVPQFCWSNSFSSISFAVQFCLTSEECIRTFADYHKTLDSFLAKLFGQVCFSDRSATDYYDRCDTSKWVMRRAWRENLQYLADNEHDMMKIWLFRYSCN